MRPELPFGVFYNEAYEDLTPREFTIMSPIPLQITPAPHYDGGARPILIRTELRMGRPLDQLAHEYGLIIRRHPVATSLVLFKYDQLESPMGEPLVQQCRGLILDEKNYWNAVCRPFDKFFNEGEHLAPQMDWSKARVQEKLDGSMCCLWYHGPTWHMSTLGSPNGGGGVGWHAQETYMSLFWRLWYAKRYPYPSNEWKDYTFMFELTAPENRVVVQQADRDLTLIGVRHCDGAEISLDKVDVPYKKVREFPLASLDDILATFKEMSPLKQEGYVVVGPNFERVKVKHPGYVALHHMRGEGIPTLRRIIELSRSGEDTEVLTYFPEWTGEFLRHDLAKRALISDIDLCWKTFKDAETQKEFAACVVDMPYSGVVFSMRAGRVASIEEALSKMHVDRLIGLLKPYLTT